MKQPPSLDQICRWLANLGYEGEKPKDIDAGIKLLRLQQRNHPPTNKQLEYLDNLDYDGPPPYDRRTSSM